MSQTNAAIVLGEFGQKIGLPQIAFADNRFCTLTVDEIIVHLELSEDGQHLNCYLWIADVGEDHRAEVALVISDANYLLARTRGTTLGMNRLTGDLLLAVQIPDATLTLAVFETAFEKLVGLAKLWQKKIIEVLASAPPGAEAAPLPPARDDGFSFRV